MATKGKSKSKAKAEETEALTGMEKVIADATDGKIRANIQDFVDWAAEEHEYELDPADVQVVITGYKFFQKSDLATERREERAEQKEAEAEEREERAAAKKTAKKSASKRTAKKSTSKKAAASKGRGRRSTTKKVAETADEDF